MPRGVNCHSGDFQECVRVASIIKFPVLQECRIIDGSQQLMSSSLQAPFLYIVLKITLNKRKHKQWSLFMLI